MRRIGLVISSLLSAGLLLAGARAFASESKPVAVDGHRFELKSGKPAARPIFTPAKATKQGQINDRLVRPHRSFDASAGMVG